jgi:hypothetical protein
VTLPGKKSIVWPSSRVALAVLGMTLAGSAGQHSTSPGPAHNGRSTASTGRVWKSQTTGNEYLVRVQNDVFHAEWINVPVDWAKRGAYLRTECRRVGSKWVGTSESRLPCGERNSEQNLNWCHLQTRTEIDSFSSDRITGHGQSVRKVDCQQCKILEAGWNAFEWTPAQ